MGSAAFAGAAFIVGIAVGWVLRRRAAERAIEAVDRGEAIRQARVDGSSDTFQMSDGGHEIAAKALAAESERLAVERERLSVEREDLGREREALTHDAAAHDVTPLSPGEGGRSRPRAQRGGERGRARGEQVGQAEPDAVVAERASATPSQARRGRDTTVLVCDVGSTAGDEAVPANVLRCLTDLQKVLSGIIGDEGGAIDRYAGERLIAVFAAKRKNSDHAGRALEAAERIANNVGALSRRLQYDLRIGIGIHSGSLLLGEDGHVDSSAIGDAIDLASRLEALASEAKVSVVLTGAVLEHAERGEESFEILGDVPLGAGERVTRIFTPRRRDGAVQLDLIDLAALRA